MNYPNYFYPQQQQNQIQNQIQNGGLVSVRNVVEARNYPVAPGNSVTFKDENAPYVYTKTMGFSQLDRPIFEVFRLVKEEMAPEIEAKPVDYRHEIDELRAEIEKLKKMIEEEDDEYITDDKSVHE